MPEYSYICESCDLSWSEVWTMNEYDIKSKKVKCPDCKNTKVFRDFGTDNVCSNYIKGLHECKTIGEYAEKQTKEYGKYKVEDMERDQVTKRTGGMKDLPTGMSRINNYKDTFLKKDNK